MASNRTCILCEENEDDTWARPECCEDHWFHLTCLKRWANEQTKCPFDRKSFTKVIDSDGDEVALDLSSKDSEIDMQSAFLALMQLAMAAGSSEDVPVGEQKELQCDICKKTESKEVAVTNTCKHQFHRECLEKYSKKESLCPKRGCHSEYTGYGNNAFNCILGVNENIKRIFSRTADINYKCHICLTQDPLRERARAEPCGHEFHRGCLIERVRTRNKCKVCHARIERVNCQMGPTISSRSIRKFNSS